MSSLQKYLQKVTTGFAAAFHFFQSQLKKIMNKISADELSIPATPNLPPASPAKLAREAAALSSMVANLNKEAGVQGEPPEVVLPSGSYKVQPSAAKRVETEAQHVANIKASAPPGVDFLVGRGPTVNVKPPEQVTHRRSPFNPRLLFYTGRLKAGKDFVAAATGATIFGFADPLYAMRKFFFGEVDKDKFGAREILQLFGQWGRGVVSAQYPLNASRASFTVLARRLGSAGDFGIGSGVNSWLIDWDSFGRNENIWLDGMLRRVKRYTQQHGNEEKRIACVNVRFPNEHKALTESGWTHFHVMCSPQTWEERIRAAGLDPKSPAMLDTSEQMAINLDRQALQAAQRNPSAMLRCIWNDDKQPSPALKAFHSLDSFKADLEIFS